MKQYSKRMVMVHWLTFVLLIAAWFLGDTLAEATDDNKATLAGYIVHAAAGGMILLLAFAQLVLRRKDDTPTMLADAPIYQFAAKAVHYALYAVLVVLPLSGVATLITGGAGKALLAGDASLLPKEADYENLFAREVHETLVAVLIALVVLHILGALKHQFIMKDGLLSRMWWRKKG